MISSRLTREHFFRALGRLSQIGYVRSSLLPSGAIPVTSPHTPGPWRASFGMLIRVVAGDHVICGVHKLNKFKGIFDEGVARSNARLIATAPDLLDYARYHAEKGDLVAKALVSAAELPE